MGSRTTVNACRERQLRTHNELDTDGKKTFLIAISCISLVVAGLFSRASLADNSETLGTPKPVRVGTKIEAASTEARFARSELRRYRSLARELKQREGEEANGPNKEKMARAIAILQSRLESTDEAVHEFETSSGRRDFKLENLKGSLFVLQDAGQNAVSTFVDIDNAQGADSKLVARYVFKESRTGQ